MKILLYETEDFTPQMNSKILKCPIKFIRKNIALVALCFLLDLFFFLTKYLVFNIFYMCFMFNLCTEFTVSGISFT